MSARIATTSLSPALGEICAVQRPAGVTGAMVTVVVLTVGVLTVGAVVGAVEAAADVVVVDVDVDVVVGVPENRLAELDPGVAVEHGVALGNQKERR